MKILLCILGIIYLIGIIWLGYELKNAKEYPYDDDMF